MRKIKIGNRAFLFHEDCLDVLVKLKSKSVDMVLCDLPYGTTKCKWDSLIDLSMLWDQYKRVIKPKGAIILFSGEPFTSVLINSNLEMFKYKWTWVKNTVTGFMQAKVAPLRTTEDICVFSFANIDGARLDTAMGYYPIGLMDTDRTYEFGDREIYGKNKSRTVKQTKTNYPKDVLYFDIPDKSSRLHPTQKPVDLCVYLIETYTKEIDVVLDNTMGSGSTGEACFEANRRFIGIEKDKKYFDIAVERLRNVVK